MAAQTALFSTNIDNVANLFVCLGDDRRGQTSPDGETWTARTLTTGTYYSGLTYGKNICVACASNANAANMFMTSPDGATWTARNNTALGASIGWYGITYGNGTFVAVAGGADNTKTGTSTNTIDFTVNTGVLTSADYRCIAFGEGRFVTLSYQVAGAATTSNYVRYSVNGISWSSGSGLPYGRWKAIAYDAALGRFVAVAQMPVRVIANTTNTIAFTAATKRITWASGTFSANGYFVNGKISITGSASNNGTFTIAAVGTTTMDVVEAITDEAASATEVIVAIEGSAYSEDGITWTTGSPTATIFPSLWYGIASNGAGTLVAMTNTAGVRIAARSTDGINWTTINLPLASTWGCIAYGNGRFIINAQSVTSVTYSDDNGVTWKVGPQGAYVWRTAIWAPFPVHSNDSLTIDRGATITVNTDQHGAWSAMTLTNGKLLIKNTSTTDAIRFVTMRTSGASAQALTLGSGLFTIDIQGNWIDVGTGDGTTNQSFTVPYTDYVPCLWVQTGPGGTYEVWLNVSGAYGGTLKQYQDGLLDVSTGQKGKFFTQTPHSIQDKYITRTATITNGLFSITLDSIDNLYQGASIVGSGLQAASVIEIVPHVITASAARTLTWDTTLDTITASSGSFITDGYAIDDVLTVAGTTNNNGIYTVTNVTATVLTVSQNLTNEGPLSATATITNRTVKINLQPALTLTSVPVRIFNPYASQFTNTVVFGDGVHGNVVPSGAHIRIPNIMLTSDTPANLHTGALAGSQLGMSFVFTSGSNYGGKLYMDKCLFDEAYHNFNQAQVVTMTYVGMHIRPTITEVYALTVDGFGLGMPAVRRYNTANVWAGRDVRDLQINSWLMNYITGATINDVAMVLQSPHAITAASATAPTGMLNLANSDDLTISNIRMYSLNTTRAYQCGLAFTAPITNSTFTNIEFYGGPMMSLQFSSGNTFTNIINAETMFDHSHNYTAGTRVTFDPNTGAQMLGDGTKYYFKARTFFTRDRAEFTESRVYSATPFKGSTYYPDYITAYCNAPQSVLFAWTHRTPMYTTETSPATNADAHNFIEIYRGTSSPLTPALSNKVAGLNIAPSISIPTIVTWATETRSLTLEGSGSVYTITASSGNFITDGYADGQKITIRGSIDSVNNGTFTITDVTDTVITVTEALSTQAAYTKDLSIVAKYIPTTKKIHDASAGGRTIRFYGLSLTGGSPTFQFAATGVITRSAGNFTTDGWAVGDKVNVSGSTYNNTNFNQLTVTAVGTTTITCGNDLITAEGPGVAATLTVNKAYCAAGSFVTDGYTVGDIVVGTGSGTGGNNKTFTVSGVVAATINFIETAVSTGSAETTVRLNVKHMPIPKVVFVNASYARRLTFVNAVSSAAADRIFTFDSIAKTITASGASAGSFITDGFVVGDKVTVTGSSLNNTVTLTLTAVAATVLTATAVLERQFDEVSTTAVLTANRIVSPVGAGGTTPSFALDGFVIGDTITVAGTTDGTNDGTFTVNNVYLNATSLQTHLSVTSALTDQAQYTSGVTITATKKITRQPIYFTANRTFTPASAGRTFTGTQTGGAWSFLQDGYIVGDKVLVNGTARDNSIFTISVLTATVMTVLEVVSDTAVTTNAITWTHTGQRPAFTTTATITLVWTAATKTLTLGSGTWTGTYNFLPGDKIFITGQRWNNGLFTINTIPTTTTITVLEPVIVDTTTYNATAGTTSTVYGYHPTQKLTVTAAAARIMTFDDNTKSITLSGASAGSFINDGYYVGDCVQIAGTASGINDGYFTISSLTATAMYVNEIIYDGVENSGATISAPNIVNDTPYYYIVRKYDDTGTYNDSEEIYVKPTLQGINTNLATYGTTMATNWTASGITVGAATRISPFLNTISTQANDAVICTTTTAAGTLTQGVPTAVDNTYTFSVWVSTQPTILKIATLTAAAGRTLKWDSKSVTRTVTFDAGAKTIVAGSGDWTTDFAIGDKITITGTANNNTTYTINTVVALTITIDETPVAESSISATLKAQKITASTGSFITDGYEVGDHILTAGCTAAQNNGWFTITNVKALILNLAETVVTEAAYSATATITNYFNDTLSIGGKIALGTAEQTFTATALWQKVSVTFTATAATTNAVITITDNRRSLCIIGAKIDLGTTAKPYLTTTSQPVSNANEVRDITLIRTWCRGYGEAANHSGIELQLLAAPTGELWTEVYCGTDPAFEPSFDNKIFDTWAGSGHTIIFNQASQNNIINGFEQSGKGAPTAYALAYFAATSLNNRILNLTYDLCGTIMAALASFNTQSNDMRFYNWNIDNWRNYATTAGNAMLFATSNATSGLICENLIMDNSDFPIQNLALNFTMKGVSGGNVKPLNSAHLYAMPLVNPYVLGGGATNYDSIATSSPTLYTTVYDTIFHEAYFTTTTGALNLIFNASAETVKPYTLTGTASFDNKGRLFFLNAGDAIEYTWPHKILGVSGFRNVPFLLNGVDLGNTPSLLEGLMIQYKIDTTGTGYPANWTEATPAALSALQVSATAGFYFKLKITAKAGMKYSTAIKPFVQGERIRGLSSLATATVERDFYYGVQGTVWFSSDPAISGTFVPGETIVRDSDGEVRCINVATNTTFALFPSATSYIDGLQIYTTVDQTAKYPANVATITLTNIVPDSLYYIYNSDTQALVARGTATGTPPEGETTIDYPISVIFENDFNIGVNVRKSSAPVKYFPYETGSRVTSAGATVFIAQIIDSVVLNTYGSIADDWTVNETLKTIKHTQGTAVYTVQALYSWLEDYFDEPNYLDDQIPMSASTPTEYNLINGWVIDDPSFKYLTGGSIQTSGWTHTALNPRGIRILTLASISGVDDTDIGSVVAGATTGDTGKLLAYNTTDKKLWIRTDAADDLFDNASENINVNGSLAGAMGGAISVSGENIWSNIFTLGSLVSSAMLDVYQNDIEITPWWTTGQIDVLIKVKEAGIEIDRGNLTILARTYGTLYDHFVIDASSGRNPVPLAAFADSNNQTSQGVVGAAPYTNISISAFGAKSHDLGNGNGAKPFEVDINCATLTVAQVYEYLKYVTGHDASGTLNGVNKEYYTAVGDIRLNYTGLASGPFVEGDAITSSAGGSGHIVSLIVSTGTTGILVIRNVHGTFADANTLTSGSTTAAINGTPDPIVASKQAPFGTFAGGKFFAARGVFISNMATTDANNYVLIDSTNTPQYPPTTVSVQLTDVVVGSVCLIYETGNRSNEILPATTASSSTVSTIYTWTGDINITIRVRKGTSAPKYLPYEATGTITNAGFALAVNQIVDPIA